MACAFFIEYLALAPVLLNTFAPTTPFTRRLNCKERKYYGRQLSHQLQLVKKFFRFL